VERTVIFAEAAVRCSDILNTPALRVMPPDPR
jgi:hypothetical protein